MRGRKQIFERGDFIVERLHLPPKTCARVDDHVDFVGAGFHRAPNSDIPCRSRGRRSAPGWKKTFARSTSGSPPTSSSASTASLRWARPPETGMRKGDARVNV